MIFGYRGLSFPTSIWCLSVFLIFWFSSCEESSDPTNGFDPNNDSLKIVEALPLLVFTSPVDLQNNGDENLFIVEQQGIIKMVHNNPNTANAEDFLDIRSLVDDSSNEQGLLGLAFHPEFSQNGYLYINYTNNQGNTQISRFEVDAQNPTVVNPSSELHLMEIPQPFINHNGGQLVFGPDGYLYISSGDGGSLGDPLGHGQNRTNLLGTILRIDVNQVSGNLNYGIPSDNPFAGNQVGYREEIFAYGLRNPWRMNFDILTKLLWVGDVGENNYEEIDIIEKGGNYGWKIMEATSCFIEPNCNQSGLIDPYYQYAHFSGPGSITGGTVYRGSISVISGWYIYSDYVTGSIFGLEASSSNPTGRLLFDTNYKITSFGTDHLEELYFCDRNGKIYKFTAG